MLPVMTATDRSEQVKRNVIDLTDTDTCWDERMHQRPLKKQRPDTLLTNAARVSSIFVGHSGPLEWSGRSAKSMAIRILNRLDVATSAVATSSIPGPGRDKADVDAHVASFIAIKAECVRGYSRFLSPDDLVYLTGWTWERLEKRELAILNAIGWRLYTGHGVCADFVQVD